MIENLLSLALNIITTQTGRHADSKGWNFWTRHGIDEVQVQCPPIVFSSSPLYTTSFSMGFNVLSSLIIRRSIEEAIERANNTRYGLAAGIITKDLNLANSFAIDSSRNHMDNLLSCFWCGLSLRRIQAEWIRKRLWTEFPSSISPNQVRRNSHLQFSLAVKWPNKTFNHCNKVLCTFYPKP